MMKFGNFILTHLNDKGKKDEVSFTREEMAEKFKEADPEVLEHFLLEGTTDYHGRHIVYDRTLDWWERDCFDRRYIARHVFKMDLGNPMDLWTLYEDDNGKSDRTNLKERTSWKKDRGRGRQIGRKADTEENCEIELKTLEEDGSISEFELDRDTGAEWFCEEKDPEVLSQVFLSVKREDGTLKFWGTLAAYTEPSRDRNWILVNVFHRRSEKLPEPLSRRPRSSIFNDEDGGWRNWLVR